jgi:hypothetical protein
LFANSNIAAPRESERDIFLAADVEMIELDNKKNLAFFQRLKSF